MRRLFTLVFILFIVCSADNLYSCTSAIFSGKCTPDGRPLLWKHRDTGEENNRIEYYKGEKYGFLALINSPITKTPEAWTGTNEVGFSIMNTASYNLKNDNISSKLMDKEGEVMYKALGSCKSLKDFEDLLDNYKRPMGVEANFGVIDAFGGAAYYEVNNNSWKKIDVNDPKIAPQGYIVYTNHSNTGRLDEGMGYIRYTNADKIIKEAVARNVKFTPQWIFNNLSRSFYHSVLGVDLVKDKELVDKCNGWFIDQDFIPRRSSTCSIVVHGVKEGENPLNSVMWTILGYPPVGIAVPLMVAAKDIIPAYMLKSKDSNNSKMCDWVLERKREIFPIKRGNGNKYFNFNVTKLYMSQSIVKEGIIFKKANPILEDIREGEDCFNELIDLYNDIEKMIK